MSIDKKKRGRPRKHPKPVVKRERANRGPKGPHHWIPNPTGKGRCNLYSDEDLLSAIQQCGGVVSDAANMLGCCSATIHQRAKKNPEIAKKIVDCKKLMVEIANSNIYHYITQTDDIDLQAEFTKFCASNLDPDYRAAKQTGVINNNLTINQEIVRQEQILNQFFSVEDLKRIKAQLEKNRTQQIEDKNEGIIYEADPPLSNEGMIEDKSNEVIEEAEVVTINNGEILSDSVNNNGEMPKQEEILNNDSSESSDSK